MIKGRGSRSQEKPLTTSREIALFSLKLLVRVKLEPQIGSAPWFCSTVTALLFRTLEEEAMELTKKKKPS